VEPVCRQLLVLCHWRLAHLERETVDVASGLRLRARIQAVVFPQNTFAEDTSRHHITYKR